MANLADDGAPPQPPHPTMPPYASRETHLHPSVLNLPVEQPRIPKIWDSPSLGTNYHVEQKLESTTTMTIRTMAASHATTLPTLPTMTLAKDSNTWQHNNIDITQGVDCDEARHQNNTQDDMCLCRNNLQPITMLPPNQSTNPGNTGQLDELQCQGYGKRLTHTNNITSKITSTPKHTHADIPNLCYNKKSEKVNLPLPQHQHNNYRNTATNPVSTRINNSATHTHHHHPHPAR